MHELYANATAGMIGLIIFFLFFCGLLIWLFRPGSKKHYEDAGKIPLQEDEEDKTNER